MKNLRELLEHEIQDLYSAESQLIEALPDMEKAAKDAELKKALKNHLKETKEQKKRLEMIAKKLGIKAEGDKCKGMEGLIKEGQKMLKEAGDEEVRDAGIIGASQRVEHYEIAGYGCARYYARMLGEDKVAEMLAMSLEEEKDADELLNDIAIEQVNRKAVHED